MWVHSCRFQFRRRQTADNHNHPRTWLQWSRTPKNMCRADDMITLLGHQMRSFRSDHPWQVRSLNNDPCTAFIYHLCTARKPRNHTRWRDRAELETHTNAWYKKSNKTWNSRTNYMHYEWRRGKKWKFLRRLEWAWPSSDYPYGR